MTQLIQKIADALANGRSMTSKQMADEFGCALPHARLLSHRLHNARQIHIREWVRVAKVGRYAPVYMWGDAVDAPAPLLEQEKIVKQAETESYVTIAKLRTTVDPSVFDPFRVLRAQVGGMA
ncbi:hypothetical protein ELS24_10205 [Achromobacter spanius]|uniref:hypothetical protein n=1 Tax=Achromobacter spanius TaxID=217203 RepID=UPI000F8F8903|nr:hypothetical protein [Achromobacter spanius]AZS78783.1 hypothetical protein ELS24_10205 [Achromobacter spanius]